MCIAEDMALNDKDRQWISNEIRSALKPQGWRKAAERIREIGSVIAILGICIGLMAITAGALYQSFAHVREDAEFRTRTRDNLDNIEAQLKKIDDQVVSLRALFAASQPLKKENRDAASGLLADAREHTIPSIPTPIVEQAGHSFIDAAQSDPLAWPVALDFVSYRTGLNQAPDPGPLQPASDFTEFAFRFRNAFKGRLASADIDHLLSEIFFSKLRVPRAEGADAGDLEYRASFFATDQEVPKWIVFKMRPGHPFTLDDFMGRNVIFESSALDYHGGAVDLSRVFFVNCDARGLPNLPNTRSMARSIISMNPVDAKIQP